MNEALQVIGCAAATAACGVALLAPGRRLTAVAALVALSLALALLLGEGWDELESLREEGGALIATALGGIALIGGLAAIVLRWRWLLPLLLVAALPFRIPIETGTGEEVNLLVPLYAVIAAGAVAAGIDAMREGGVRRRTGPRPLLIALAAVLVLYALQSAYSEDIAFAARNVGFFLVPFAVLFVLLIEVPWTPRLLGAALAVVAAEALLFALVGVGQHLAGEIFWNPALETSNDFHFYFRVNSLFWDPNIYARYLALAAILLMALLLWTEEVRRAAALALAVAVLFAGMIFAFSQTSFASLLAGLAVLAALRWSVRWAAVGTILVSAATIISVSVVAGLSGSERTSRSAVGDVTSGHSTLIEGGLDLAVDRPIIGHGSASFSEAFAEAEDIEEGDTTISHSEPVTVSAEQGVIGLLAYLALLAAAVWTLFSGMRRIAPGFGAPPQRVGDPARGGPASVALARIAVAGAFVALLAHTVGYAAYLTDPLTWALLAVGAALSPAAGAGAGEEAEADVAEAAIGETAAV